MKKRNILTILIVLIILVFKIDAKAAVCTTTEKSELKQLARTMEINPYIDTTPDPMHQYSYSVNIVNFSEKFYIEDEAGTKYDKKITHTNETNYGSYKPGSVVIFKVYGAIGTNCSYEQFATIRVSFPFYNDYYLSPLCEGIEEFALCQRTYSGKIPTQEYFEEEIKKYKESLQQQEPPQEEKNFIEKMTDYVKENPWVIGVVIVVVLGIVIIIVKKKKEDKNKIKVDLDLK